ncbi:MAG: selenocysteine lyase [Candidatus Vogelbacteria bacterium CG10_big_fil_rev_8_21_14_0_10_45_14]|uniref:cysteine desulfurase n=1 Tax=Candidatus Vogelbacteria bacterium CG10_big_fil_rev_8_21_14_0_10_45_14 TaxID=1975042 RepID=A0A2H0RI56_9BACT|nr:MAG: selenocysteine lyase [Candidatus Vogelbacteria bacterium CG10_big_fil_rev_8_21_14_0_10_45_14]
MFDVMEIRKQFPVLSGNSVPVYLDSACMAMKPEVVLSAMDEYYRTFPACGGRSVHRFGEKVERKVSETRQKVSRFIGAKNKDEIIFTRNTTEGINLLVNSFPFVEGDVVVTTDKEHNSNLIPWQLLARKKRIVHKIIKRKDDGTFDMDALGRVLKEGRVRMLALTHTSNWDGEAIPAKEISKLAKQYGALLFLDVAQTLPHKKVNVQSLDADFLAGSGHKMYGPTGTGFLYGKEEHLRTLAPFMVGGGTVADVSPETHVLLPPPACFEAGLQDYAGILGLGAAVDFLQSFDMAEVSEHEESLARKLRAGLSAFEGVRLFGDGSGSIVSFTHNKFEPERVAVMLEEVGGIMVRSGRHCVHLFAERMGLPKGTVRASFAMYNTEAEVNTFVATMDKIVSLT